jgi:hypothetical protein
LGVAWWAILSLVCFVPWVVLSLSRYVMGHFELGPFCMSNRFLPILPDLSSFYPLDCHFSFVLRFLHLSFTFSHVTPYPVDNFSPPGDISRYSPGRWGGDSDMYTPFLPKNKNLAKLQIVCTRKVPQDNSPEYFWFAKNPSAFNSQVNL